MNLEYEIQWICTTDELSNNYDWLIALLIQLSKQGVIGRVLSMIGEGKLELVIKCKF